MRPVLAEHFLARVAAHALVGRVDVDHAEIGVAQDHAVGGGMEDPAVLLLARAQRLLGALALADVAADVEHVRLALVEHRDRAQLPLLAPAVRARARSRASSISPASTLWC